MPRANVRGCRAGFSLVELMIALLVVSVLAYVAVPNIEIVRFKMDAAARGGVAALMAAQRLAVKRQHNVVVAVDTANRRLRIHEDRDNDGMIDAGEDVRPVPFDDGVIFGRGRAPLMSGDAGVVTFSETQDGLPAIRYIRNGSAAAEGSFYLTSSRSDRDSEYAKDTRAIRVDRSTGRVTWYRYDPPDWIEEF